MPKCGVGRIKNKLRSSVVNLTLPILAFLPYLLCTYIHIRTLHFTPNTRASETRQKERIEEEERRTRQKRKKRKEKKKKNYALLPHRAHILHDNNNNSTLDPTLLPQPQPPIASPHPSPANSTPHQPRQRSYHNRTPESRCQTTSTAQERLDGTRERLVE